MTDRRPHFEIVQTDAGWHTRLRGGNGEPVTSTEVYTEPTTAEHAVVVTAKAFGIDLEEPLRHADEFGGGWVGGRTPRGDIVHVSIEWVDER